MDDKLNFLDVYDKEFLSNMQVARGLIDEFKKEDRLIAKKWLTRICNLSDQNPAVKKYRNQFLQYFLQLLQKTHENHADTHDDTAPTNSGNKAGFMSRWTPDRRTYIAAQPIPGQGTLIYMAVSKDPSLGWEIAEKF